MSFAQLVSRHLLVIRMRLWTDIKYKRQISSPREVLSYARWLLQVQCYFGFTGELGLVISGFSAGAIGTALELIGVIRFASFALPLTMTMFGVVDVVCTIGFASFTCDTNATLDRHQVQATNLIAKRSVVICSLASASAVLFWIYWGVSIVVDDSTMRILFCFVENLFMAAMMMWVWLKVELDSLANTPFNAINLDQTLSESKFPL
eukprot:TRINITY_DN25561_c0_g1_i2.p1 TRINITY_DN25561_c0_g1~~TRINITY_DN25561_c0_g1_i2.p1  ORF type:complete len:206 (+),score=35.05 TRINITY_DN25561_c0_g1_i2:26-643(+)